MHRIVFLERATLGAQITVRPPGFAHTWIDHDRTDPDQVVNRLAGATIAVLNKVNLTEAVLQRLPDLRLVAVAATGTDCVDKAACRRRGIAVTNIRGYAVNTVPEHVFALVLALRRHVLRYRQDVLDGAWQRARQFSYFDHPIRDLNGARLGIIGAGVLGRRVAEIGRGFGMAPVFAGRKGQASTEPRTPWDEVLETSDVLTLHCPLTPETRGLIALPEFRRMKRRPLLINTARGGLVVEEDLEVALREGLIAGAGVDVTLPEPPPLDGPLMRIARHPNAIVTPHVAWASDEAQQALADQLIDNIEAWARGAPVNLVGGD